MKLGFLDTAILVVYLAIVAFIGFWVGRKEKQTTRDYFLAGSRLPWYAIGLSMVASSISTEQFIISVSSLVNSTSTVFTIDIYQRFHKEDVPAERLIRVGRFTGAVVLVIGVACVPLVQLWEHIFAYCQEVWVLLAGPTVAVFLVGILWRRATNAAATVIMAASFPLTTVPFVQKLHPFLPGPIENIFVFGLLVLVVCVALMIAISLFTRAPDRARAEALHWTPGMLRLPADVAASKPHWYQCIGLWWALMVGAFVVIYALLW